MISNTVTPFCRYCGCCWWMAWLDSMSSAWRSPPSTTRRRAVKINTDFCLFDISDRFSVCVCWPSLIWMTSSLFEQDNVHIIWDPQATIHTSGAISPRSLLKSKPPQPWHRKSMEIIFGWFRLYPNPSHIVFPRPSLPGYRYTDVYGILESRLNLRRRRTNVKSMYSPYSIPLRRCQVGAASDVSWDTKAVWSETWGITLMACSVLNLPVRFCNYKPVQMSNSLHWLPTTLLY